MIRVPNGVECVPALYTRTPGLWHPIISGWNQSRVMGLCEGQVCVSSGSDTHSRD